MVKKRIIKVFLIMIIVLILFSTTVFAAEHFKAFASQTAINDAGSWGTDTMDLMVDVMQTLGYNNYYGTNRYHTTSSKQDVLNYINMTGNNYGFAVLAHGSTTHFSMGDSNQRITTSDISGTWHLVLLNSCRTCINNSFGVAFKTVGYDNRATIGFYDSVTFSESYYFWRTISEMAGTADLNTIVHFADDLTLAPGVIWGDSTWDGQAWT